MPTQNQAAKGASCALPPLNISLLAQIMSNHLSPQTGRARARARREPPTAQPTSAVQNQILPWPTLPATSALSCDYRRRIASRTNPQARISTPARQILTGEVLMTEPKAAPCSPLSIIFSSLSIISSSIPLEADRAHVLIPAEVDVLYFSIRLLDDGRRFKIVRPCLV